jgi:hypothetical protein
LFSKHNSAGAEASRGRAWPLVVAAAAAFCLLAAMPVILPALHVQLQARAATSSHGIALRHAPNAPRPVSLPPVARPIDPGQPPASLPVVNAAREAAAVSAEDRRMRVLLHDAAHIYQPEVIPTRGSLPTLVLTAGQSSYTAATLVQYGALVMLPHDAALLLDNVFVATNARLFLGGAALRTLYLDNGSGGFATIVAWDGNLSFRGTARQPMTIVGWDRTVRSPAADTGGGRSYIREVGGKMTLSNVRVSSLGFWSGRTGGVAWTGLTARPSGGSATNSTFTDDTYGAFVSRASGVTFRGDLFEFNELDGLHMHRYSIKSSVISSSASRNGGNGFIVSPATQNILLEGDVSEHNAGNGYFVNGKPLATGASASGGSVVPGSGTVIKDSAALNNGKIGILVEGGTGTVIEGDQVCAAVTGIAIRYNVTDAVLTGNDIRCGPRSGLSIGPSTPGLMISGNTVAGPRTGVLVRNSGAIELDNNRITGATVFGVSARGVSSKVTGVGNVISGSGFRAIDARADASMPALSSSNTSGWAYRGRVTFWSYLQYHPLAALWLGILILVLLAWAWSHRRRLPSHPYPASTRWRGEDPSTLPAEPVPTPVPALAGASSWPAETASGASWWPAETASGASSWPAEPASGASAWPAEPAIAPATRAAEPALGMTAALATTAPGLEPTGLSFGQLWNGHRELGDGLRQPGYDQSWPTDGRQEPASGDRAPTNGDRDPANGDRDPANGDRDPANGDRDPANGDRAPAYSDGAHANGDRDPIWTPPWEPTPPPDKAPGDSGKYFDVFTPLPKEVDRQ